MVPLGLICPGNHSGLSGWLTPQWRGTTYADAGVTLFSDTVFPKREQYDKARDVNDDGFGTNNAMMTR